MTWLPTWTADQPAHLASARQPGHSVRPWSSKQASLFTHGVLWAGWKSCKLARVKAKCPMSCMQKLVSSYMHSVLQKRLCYH